MQRDIGVNLVGIDTVETETGEMYGVRFNLHQPKRDEIRLFLPRSGFSIVRGAIYATSVSCCQRGKAGPDFIIFTSSRDNLYTSPGQRADK
jgi:hypothetical protein